VTLAETKLAKSAEDTKSAEMPALFSGSRDKEVEATINEDSKSTVKFLVDIFSKLTDEFRNSRIPDEVKDQKKKRKYEGGNEKKEDEKEKKLKKKFNGFKCFKCHGYGHKSNQCPTRDWDDDEEEEFKGGNEKGKEN